ncbi:MAG: hypothetical protein ACYC5N_04915 [Endomicrobiales bacterium]
MRTKKKQRVLLALLLVVLLAPASFAGDIFDGLSSLDKDAYVHFSAGVLVSHVSYPLLRKYLHDKNKATWYSLALTFLLGVAKETADSSRTGFSGADLAAGTLGGFTLFVVTFD